MMNKKDKGIRAGMVKNHGCRGVFLLFELYRAHLISSEVAEENIIELALDEIVNAR